MNKYPVWMDCDTGTDDTVAIMLAHALDEIDILGISVVNGNCSLEDGYRNTQYLNGLLGNRYPVYRGAAQPMQRVLSDNSAMFHGENGFGNVPTEMPANAVHHPEAAWDALYACAAAHPGELNLIATGPMTNVATAFIKYPDLPKLLKQVLIMGGSATFGNRTPAAEFNIYVDPEAAAILFRSGAKIIMCGLDVTLQAYFTPQDLDDLEAGGSLGGKLTHDILQCGISNLMRMGFSGVAMHDSCPVMYLVHPELFGALDAGVAVETRGSITNGKTVTDLFCDFQFGFKNATVVLDVDRDAFISLLKEKLETIR